MHESRGRWLTELMRAHGTCLGLILGLLMTHQAVVSGHEHRAPHGGSLVELGEEFAHVELVLDAVSGQLSAYVLDGEAEEPVRVAQDRLALSLTPRGAGQHPIALELRAVANPLTGETVGDTSEFGGQSEALRGTQAFEGVLGELVVKGERFEAVPISVPAVEHDASPGAGT